MPISPSINSGEVLSVTININKSDITDSYSLVSIVTSNSVNGVQTAKLTFSNGDLQEQDFPISDSSIFNLGNDLEVRAGYGSVNDQIFRGLIVKHEIEINAEHNLLNIHCESKAKNIRLDMPEAPDNPSLIVSYGEDILQLLGKFDDEKNPTDPITTRSNIRGQVQFQGSSKALPGSFIELRGVGARFCGVMWVCSVTHEIATGNWVTEAQFYKHTTSQKADCN